ncbi:MULTISPECIES: ABC transporter ATP-binding protein [Staphylococcus]|uniref:Putative hemin import ATP-binding protein HrtA n=1 Tax=Staphylococcus chromogenes TaxID=46126 RepID=A0AAE5W8E5_STACR|nr:MULTISPECIES: ABC transporter ATP-binding protein [Staphylococcus]KDP12818.1 ABC transporter ATP-binding protein [Staphylococcus chromogenes MU 970]MBP0046124.1 ABC transporter ATP-binding protein [Staphylococcus chromogenes]MBV5137338.1 ABC transporter ATP-binding protein [Staphylococcus chromogenes]MBV5191245.1 ABC transporter ATP-binding protein [Staphylococcus chromogenes]MBW3132605.1 ABC transporter ATP-binding protein [Staphylococcus chromogenes]
MSLKVKHLTKSFGKGEAQTQVLKGIDFEVQPGEFIILNGASGSGKSTLLSIIGGLLSPSEGQVILNGEDMSQLSSKALTAKRLKNIGFIFQSSHLLPYLKVKDQLVLVGKEAGLAKKEAEERAKQLLEDIGLSHRLISYPHMLSGGEKQRVAIMRAWMNEPQLLLADEPTASLDAKRATEVVEMIKNQVKTKGTIGIMVTHDERLFEYADRMLYLDEGNIVSKS